MEETKPLARMRHHFDGPRPGDSAILKLEHKDIALDKALEDNLTKKTISNNPRYLLPVIIGATILVLCVIGCYMSLQQATLEDERDYSVMAYEDYEVENDDEKSDAEARCQFKPEAKYKTEEQLDDLGEVIAEAEKEESGKTKTFVISLGDEKLEVNVDDEGNVVLPDGKNLNPHDRRHWEVIQSILGAEYDYGEDNETDETSNSTMTDMKFTPADDHEHDDDCDTSVGVISVSEGEQNSTSE